jgi:hypothetical protein
MAHPFIAVHKSKGLEYATICTPARENGKKVNNPIYLGRVINLEEGRFRSRARGEFLYSLENGFSYPTKDPEPSIKAAIAKGSLSLGHVYCAHVLLERTGLLDLFRETEESSPDTLLALLMHRLLECHADSHASSFLERTYTRVLYPAANLTLQGVSRYLAKLGREEIRRDFLRRYISMMDPERKSVGVLIDSPGPQNDIDLPITALSNHEIGAINEVRLIYVIDRETFNPIYYRVIPSNVVDVKTLKETIDEIQIMNFNVRYSVLNTGYNLESNLEGLFSLGIDFMTRLVSDRGLYKELLVKNCETIMHPSNRLVYNKRLLFMTMNKVTLPNNRKAYAYIGVDVAKKFDGIRNLGLRENPNDPMSNEEFEKKTRTSGMFVLISSLEMDKSEALPYYYSSQTLEQIFDTSKNYTRFLPLGVQSQETFNGHLLLSFMTTIAYITLKNILHKNKYNFIDFITELSSITCGVYDDHLHVYKPTLKQKKLLKILKIKIPTKLPLKI